MTRMSRSLPFIRVVQSIARAAITILVMQRIRLSSSYSRGLLVISLLLAGCDITVSDGDKAAESGTAESSTSEAGTTTVASTDEGGGAAICEPIHQGYASAGDPCAEDGAECSYGDDCGYTTYRCEGGLWVFVEASCEDSSGMDTGGSEGGLDTGNATTGGSTTDDPDGGSGGNASCGGLFDPCEQHGDSCQDEEGMDWYCCCYEEGGPETCVWAVAPDHCGG